MEFSDPDYIGKSLKLNIDTFADGRSDHLPLVYVKILLNFDGNVFQMYIEYRHFTMKTDILQSKILNLCLILSTSVYQCAW